MAEKRCGSSGNRDGENPSWLREKAIDALAKLKAADALRFIAENLVGSIRDQRFRTLAVEALAKFN